MSKKVTLITGGNAGIGLAIVERLLENDPSMHICLACRNKVKAQTAQQGLKAKFPEAEIMIVLMDVSRLESVYKAAKVIRDSYKHIDYLYLNAGIMPVSTVDWNNFYKGLFSSKCVDMFRTGDGLLKQVDGTNPEGLREIFATNLFGHFVLVRELEDCMGGTDRTTQIIWTSSSNAKKSAFTPSDVQHMHGNYLFDLMSEEQKRVSVPHISINSETEPYSSSKYASDIISIAINDKLNKQGIYSHTTCPGLVMTNLTYGILPSWFWYLAMPLLILLRLFISTVTYSAYNGAEALVWLANQRPESLDPMTKYHSSVTFTGKCYTKMKKIDGCLDVALSTYQVLSDMEESMRSKFKG